MSFLIGGFGVSGKFRMEQLTYLHPTMSYFKTVNGKKLQASLIDQATLCVLGVGDGRISLEDAASLLSMIKDDDIYTDVERDTVEYLFENFKWTPAASEWFKNQLSTWQSQKVKTITLGELSKKHFTLEDVLTNEADREKRKHKLEAATTETNEDHDDIGLWIRLRDGQTVQVFSNFIDLEGEYVELRGGCVVPLKAVEKVEI